MSDSTGPAQPDPQGSQPSYGPGAPGAQQPGAYPPPSGQQPPTYGAPYQQARPLNPSDEKTWATLVHVLGIFFGFLPALIGYVVLKDRGPFVREHTANALNFQLTMLIAEVVGAILTLILVGVLILIAVGVLVVVCSILAAVKANNGERYVYPLTIQFVK